MSSARDRLAARVAVGVGRASRRMGLGGGSVAGGRVGLALAPDLLRVLAGERRVALVSGTNGKTTTTRLLACALAGPDGSRPVATSTAGANLPAGIVAALAAAEPGSPAVLEVDEAYLAPVADAVRPEVVVLLNLSRDQLDRVSEVRALATRWRAAITRLPEATVVANADDPLVAWAASAAAWPRWVAAGHRWRQDATGCPACDGRIEFGDGTWRCHRCGLCRPVPDVVVAGTSLTMGGQAYPVALAIPGQFNVANAAMATVAAGALGVAPPAALAAMGQVRDVEGRFATIVVGGRSARLLLAKNPAGWAELLDLVEGGSEPVVLGINAQIADGRDPSWLWDVGFERLQHRPVVATGERAHDLAVRLRHAGIDHEVEVDQVKAVRIAARASVASIDYVGNYTAFQALRHDLHRGGADPVGAGTGGDVERHGTGGGVRRHASGGGVERHASMLVVEARRARAAAPGDGTPVRAAPERATRRTGDGVSALRVVVVHPDLLGTYGDGGNGLVLANRAAWRGMDVELVLVHAEDELPASADVYLLGGGEDGPQVQAAEMLGNGRLARAANAGATVLAVCAGFQVVGTSFPGADNQPRPGLGLLDVSTVKRRAPRAVGEVLAMALAGPASPDAWRSEAAAVLAAAGPLTGFENHGGGTTLGVGVQPLATVLAGIGNDGNGTEGAWSGRIVGTYLHGPVLARNPGLADALLTLATGSVPVPLDDGEETALRRARLDAFGRRARRHAEAAGPAAPGDPGVGDAPAGPPAVDTAAAGRGRLSVRRPGRRALLSRSRTS